MSKKFSRIVPRNYIYKTEHDSREVIALYGAGGRLIGFIEYDKARKFVDKIHDLCDAHEIQQNEGAK